jgi:hypothetical protein
LPKESAGRLPQGLAQKGSEEMTDPVVDYWLNGRHCMPISVEVADDFEKRARELGQIVERTPLQLKIMLGSGRLY